MTLRFLEDHLVMIPMEPKTRDAVWWKVRISRLKVKALADAADDCWKAILAHDLDAFAAAYRASFEAQIACSRYGESVHQWYDRTGSKCAADD